MWKRVVLISMLTGCVIGSHKARYIESGVTIGLGGALAIAPFIHPPDSTSDGGPAVGLIALVAGGAIAALGLLGVLATAVDVPPSPTEWEENEPHLVRQAELAARAGRCETSNAIARQVYADHHDYYRRDFLTNVAIVRCLQIGQAQQPHTTLTP